MIITALIRHMRSSISDHVCSSLAPAMAQSRLDYANFLLYGISVSNVNKLQLLQNSLAKTVVHGPQLSGTQHVRNLHWLGQRLDQPQDCSHYLQAANI